MQKHEDEIKILIDQIEESRIISGALFGEFANDGDYTKAVIFQMLRDTFKEYETALENLIVVTKED